MLFYLYVIFFNKCLLLIVNNAQLSTYCLRSRYFLSSEIGPIVKGRGMQLESQNIA